MIQRRPGRGVCRDPNEAPDYEISSDGRFARAGDLGLHLNVLRKISGFLK